MSFKNFIKFSPEHHPLDRSKETKQNNIKRLITSLIDTAIERKASDIHFESQKDFLVIRIRVDGRLQELDKLGKQINTSIISRLKIMAKLSIDEKRLPQDGNIQLNKNNSKIDLRISCIPSIYGESIVARIVSNQQNQELNIDNIGLPKEQLKRIKESLLGTEGFFLTTGPTGSGKTTTLYACLKFLNHKGNKLITVEDPIEYPIKGINQVCIKEAYEMSFEKALQAILRQAPNTIMIGEIRDVKSAEVAINASLTGHLVLSSLHTNNAIDSVIRLREMGIAPYLIAASLKIVIAQRLIRKLCPHCKSPDKTNLTRPYLTKGYNYQLATGCNYCSMRGYKGRIGVFEFLELTPTMQEQIHNNISHKQLLKSAKSKGFKSLQEEAINLAQKGICCLNDAMLVG